jgi:hypothetical protein
MERRSQVFLLDMAKKELGSDALTALHLSVSKQQLSNWRNQRAKIPTKYISKLCRLTNQVDGFWFSILLRQPEDCE